MCFLFYVFFVTYIFFCFLLPLLLMFFILCFFISLLLFLNFLICLFAPFCFVFFCCPYSSSCFSFSSSPSSFHPFFFCYSSSLFKKSSSISAYRRPAWIQSDRRSNKNNCHVTCVLQCMIQPYHVKQTKKTHVH